MQNKGVQALRKQECVSFLEREATEMLLDVEAPSRRQAGSLLGRGGSWVSKGTITSEAVKVGGRRKLFESGKTPFCEESA